jgi:hypothetical protein
MGYKWFAKTVGSTLGKVLTGFGGAMILAEFTWCMVKEYGDAAILEPGFEPTNNDIPVSFFNVNQNYYNSHKAAFTNYMQTQYSWSSEEIDFIYENTYNLYGDPEFVGTHYIQEYFLSLSTPTSPIPLIGG